MFENFDLVSFLGGGFITVVVSGVIRTMPAPKTLGNVWYKWVYDFAHFVLANYDKSGFTQKKR